MNSINSSLPYQPMPSASVQTCLPEPAKDAQQIFQGMISILKHTAGKVGTDSRYSFGKKITVENGKNHLKISPNDLIYFCEMKSINSLDEKTMEFPSSVFEQARQGDMIYFTDDKIKYELKLSPHIRQTIFTIEEIPFDECVKRIKENFKLSPIEFLYKEDVPEDYLLLAKHDEHYLFLSPLTKRLELNKKGTVPLNFEELEFFTSHHNINLILFEQQLCKEQYIVELSACGHPKIDIFLDRNHLYVHIEDRKITQGHLLFDRVIVEEEKKIDENNALASLNNYGVLRIVIPFSKSEQIIGNVLSSTQSNIPVCDIKPVVTKTKISVRYDAGLGNKLFVRGEGTPLLNWIQGVEMECIQAPDLWTLELDSDFTNLQYKVLMNDVLWEKDKNHEIKAGQQQEIIPKF